MRWDEERRDGGDGGGWARKRSQEGDGTLEIRGAPAHWHEDHLHRPHAVLLS